MCVYIYTERERGVKGSITKDLGNVFVETLIDAFHFGSHGGKHKSSLNLDTDIPFGGYVTIKETPHKWLLCLLKKEVQLKNIKRKRLLRCTLKKKR